MTYDSFYMAPVFTGNDPAYGLVLHMGVQPCNMTRPFRGLRQFTNAAHIVRRQFSSVVFLPLSGHKVVGIVKASARVDVVRVNTILHVAFRAVQNVLPFGYFAVVQFPRDMMSVAPFAAPSQLAVSVIRQSRRPQPAGPRLSDVLKKLPACVHSTIVSHAGEGQ